MLRDILAIAEFEALTTLVAISDNCERWFINICISNISPMLMALLLPLIELSFALALTVALLITAKRAFTLNPDWMLLPENLVKSVLAIVISSNKFYTCHAEYKFGGDSYWKLHFLVLTHFSNDLRYRTYSESLKLKPILKKRSAGPQREGSSDNCLPIKQTTFRRKR